MPIPFFPCRLRHHCRLDPSEQGLSKQGPLNIEKSMSQEKKRELTFVETLGIAFLAVFIAWYFGPILIEAFLGQFWGHNMAGNIRDPDKERFKPEETFAAMNTLFSGLAFAAVAISLWYQRRDLAIQQEALIGQQKALEDEVKLNALQQASSKLPIFTFEFGGKWWTMKNEGARTLDVHIIGLSGTKVALELNQSTLIVERGAAIRFRLVPAGRDADILVRFTVDTGAEIGKAFHLDGEFGAAFTKTSIQDCIRQIILHDQAFFDSLNAQKSLDSRQRIG